MRTTFAAALLTASVLAAPAFAQTTIIPMPPAPQPTAKGPPMATGIPATPLTNADARFVRETLEANLAEIKIAQLALTHSQDKNVQDFAQKMYSDHTAANETLMQIASRHNIAMPTVLTARDQAVLDRLSQLNGLAFDHAYIDTMMRAHNAMLAAFNHQLHAGHDAVINVWVQNARPVVIQHEQLAQEINNVLPRAG